jgi:hypothetical protein
MLDRNAAMLGCPVGVVFSAEPATENCVVAAALVHPVREHFVLAKVAFGLRKLRGPN